MVNSILPLFGLRQDQTFTSLLPHNQFLYVVHYPRCTSPLVGHGFFAQELRPSLSDDAVIEEALRRASRTRRSPSDFEHTAIKEALRAYCVSTSYSLPWAILKAEYASAPPEHVHIAVVRASAVGTALLASELLSLVDDLWDFSSGTQEVLVVGHIPPSAILADIALPDLLHVAPSWIAHCNGNGTTAIHQPPRPSLLNEIPPFPDFAREWARRARKTRSADATAMAVRTASGILGSSWGPAPSRVDYAAHQLPSDLYTLAADLLIWPDRPERAIGATEARLWHERRAQAEAAVAATAPS
jgi:hypothetical protein